MTKNRLSLTPDLDKKIIQAVVGVSLVVLTNFVFYFVFSDNGKDKIETENYTVASTEYHYNNGRK